MYHSCTTLILTGASFLPFPSLLLSLFCFLFFDAFYFKLLTIIVFMISSYIIICPIAIA